MKQRYITVALLTTLIAFVAAQWGRVAEWWQSMGPLWKAFTFSCTWAFFIMVGMHYGPLYALAAVISGCLALVALLASALVKMLHDAEND